MLFARIEDYGIPLAETLDQITDRPVHLIHGEVDVQTREEVRRICEKSDDNIILGSYGTMSTGVNIKNLHHVVFASPSKSRIRVLQSIGRGLRKTKMKDKVKLYDIADDFRKPHGKNNFTLNHLAERIQYCCDENFEYRTTTIPLNTGVATLDL